MLESDQFVLSHHNQNRKYSAISCLVSLLSVFFTQFTLSRLPLFLPASAILSLLPLAVLLLVIVVGLGRLCKRIAGARASPLAYVFFSILFIWAVYLLVVRQVISFWGDIVLNTEMILLIIGLYCIASVDPGFVKHHSPFDDQFVQSPLSEIEAQGEVLQGFEVYGRLRYCKHCQKYVVGFDHHCPAFGNCIGQRNHLLFIVLLVGFITCEASFVACASLFHRLQDTADFLTLKDEREIHVTNVVRVMASGLYLWQVTASQNLVTGAMLFCLIQVLWQVPFMTWHVYCVCVNIKTDEWINWKRYPEFQVKIPPRAGESEAATQFANPYNKGILRNLKEFLTAKG